MAAWKFATEYRDSAGDKIRCSHSTADAVFLHLKAAGSMAATDFAIFANGKQMKAVAFFDKFPLTFGLQTRRNNDLNGLSKTN